MRILVRQEMCIFKALPCSLLIALNGKVDMTLVTVPGVTQTLKGINSHWWMQMQAIVLLTPQEKLQDEKREVQRCDLVARGKFKEKILANTISITRNSPPKGSMMWLERPDRPRKGVPDVDMFTLKTKSVVANLKHTQAHKQLSLLSPRTREVREEQMKQPL